jgi:hypothetical protein
VHDADRLADVQVLPRNVWHDPEEKRKDTSKCLENPVRELGTLRMSEILGSLWEVEEREKRAKDVHLFGCPNCDVYAMVSQV